MTGVGPRRAPGRIRDRYYTLGPVVRKTIESTCVHTKGRLRGKPLILEPWEVEWIDETFLVDRRTGRRVYQESTLAMPAKNGKSTIAAALALEGLAFDLDPITMQPEGGPEVYLAANSRKQAGVVGNVARNMARNSPMLARLLTIGKYDLENARTEGVLAWLAADADTAHGVNPSRYVYDELGSAPNPKLHTTLRKSTAARENPLGIVVTHVGFERYGPLGDLYDEALSNGDVDQRYTPGVESLTISRDRDAGVLMFWHGVQEEQRGDLDNPDVWKACNPASWVSRDYLAQMKKRLRLADFIRFHLNGFAAEANAWLPEGAWQQLGSGLWVPKKSYGKTPAWIGVDASTRYDLTSIVVNLPLVTDVDPDGIIDGRPALPIHRLRAEVFTADDEGSSRSMIERAAIRLRELARTYDVRGIAYDPYRFEPYPAEDLASEGLPVEAFPQSHARMVPASQDFYERVTDGYIRHDGDREFSRHVTNAIAIETARGYRIDKSKAKHHIDAAVAACMAVSIAEADLVGYGEDGPEDTPDVMTLA